jgi:ribonuclease HII
MTKVCGIDEAGRGPLAGPVTAAAVVLPEGFPLELLADSKTLSHRRRAEALKEILSLCHCGVGWVWPEEIDRINIHNAALLAMNRAWEQLCSCTVSRVSLIQVDGKYPPRLAHRSVEAVIRGDTIHPHIQAASILAKEARDRWMIRYSALEPLWQFDRHKGYPTALHRQLCREHGLSPIHRRSFRIFSS